MHPVQLQLTVFLLTLPHPLQFSMRTCFNVLGVESAFVVSFLIEDGVDLVLGGRHIIDWVPQLFILTFVVIEFEQYFLKL